MPIHIAICRPLCRSRHWSDCPPVLTRHQLSFNHLPILLGLIRPRNNFPSVAVSSFEFLTDFHTSFWYEICGTISHFCPVTSRQWQMKLFAHSTPVVKYSVPNVSSRSKATIFNSFYTLQVLILLNFASCSNTIENDSTSLALSSANFSLSCSRDATCSSLITVMCGPLCLCLVAHFIEQIECFCQTMSVNIGSFGQSDGDCSSVFSLNLTSKPHCHCFCCCNTILILLCHSICLLRHPTKPNDVGWNLTLSRCEESLQHRY